MLTAKSRLLRKSNIFTKEDFKENRNALKSKYGVAKSKDVNFQFETVATLGRFDSQTFNTLCYGEEIHYDNY